MQILKNDAPIFDILDWERLAPPKCKDQWVVGRSAYECSAAWCGSGLPQTPLEIQALLDSHPDTTNAAIVEVRPEHLVSFDKRRGGVRNADIAAVAEDRHGRMAVSIEAKADEPFDAIVEEVLADTIDAMAHGERSGLVDRIKDLASALLPTKTKALARLGDLRYQLLTGVAGALAQAQKLGAGRAVFIVHEFITPLTQDELHARNAADLDRFIKRLSGGQYPTIEAGTLLGPLTVPGKPLFGVSGAIPTLYVGKAQRRLR